jgi:hypothetical protein
MNAPPPAPVTGHYLPLVLFGLAEDVNTVTRRLKRKGDPQRADAVVLGKRLDQIRAAWLEDLETSSPPTLDARLIELADACVGTLLPLRAQFIAAAHVVREARTASYHAMERHATHHPRPRRSAPFLESNPAAPSSPGGVTRRPEHATPPS